MTTAYLDAQFDAAGNRYARLLRRYGSTTHEAVDELTWRAHTAPAEDRLSIPAQIDELRGAYAALLVADSARRQAGACGDNVLAACQIAMIRRDFARIEAIAAALL